MSNQPTAQAPVAIQGTANGSTYIKTNAPVSTYYHNGLGGFTVELADGSKLVIYTD